MPDPHRGGSLEEMAASGTSIPNDAGKMNTIPSVPRPDQMPDNEQFDYEGQGQPSRAFAADNDASMPRGPKDVGFSGEVMTGTGNSFPAEGENAGNALGTDAPGAKGSTRNLEHAKQNRGAYERMAEGAPSQR